MSSNHELVEGLSDLLANTYSLYLKTQNYHWNVRGPLFHTLHSMFEAQYTELADAVDLIAERIRALGCLAPGSYSAFQKRTKIQEGTGKESAETMIQNIVGDQKTLVQLAKALFPKAADDEATTDLLVRRIEHHEKQIWMLSSLLASN